MNKLKQKVNAIKNLKDVESILHLLEDSISLMAYEEKAAYLHATVQCPDLVKEESDPFMFLHFEDYDVWRASTRLVKYWKWRKEIFQERAFLRILDLTGFGAADETTIKDMGTRAGCFVPNDHEGTFVLFFDRRKLGKEFYNQSQQMMLRMAFFAYQHIIEEHKRKNTDEKAAFGLLNLLSSLPRWILGNRSWADLIKEAMPFELKWVRMLVLSKENEDKTWFKAILPYLQLVLKQKVSFTKVEILSFDSQLDMKNKLLAMGFQEDGLPDSLGGSFVIDKKWGRIARFAKTAICNAENLYLHGGDQKMDQKMEPKALIRNGMDDRISKHSEPLEKLIEAIPFGDKLPLLKAKEYGAHVYETESHQQLFHQFHFYDTVAAATHFCQYWEFRNKLFAERSFLSMNQAGTGSLYPTDMNVLRSGILMILPKDKKGNFVLLYDHTKTIEHPVASLKRCIFYMLYLLMEQSLAAVNNNRQVGSVEFLFRVNSRQSFQRLSSRTRFVKILEAFPLRFSSFHLIIENQQAVAVDKNTIDQAMLQMYKLFEPPEELIITHDCDSIDNTFDSLTMYGFDRENIPDYLGGEWTEESFFLWQDEVINHEARQKTSMTVRFEQKTMYFCREDRKWKRIWKDCTEKSRNPRSRNKAPGMKIKREVTDEMESHRVKRQKKNVAVASTKTDSDSPQSQYDKVEAGVEHVPGYSQNDGIYYQPQANSDLGLSAGPSNVSHEIEPAECLPFSFRRSIVDYWLPKLNDRTDYCNDRKSR